MDSRLKPVGAILVVALMLSAFFLAVRNDDGSFGDLVGGNSSGNGEPAELIYVLPKDAIPSIQDPDFDGDPWLTNSNRVVGVEVNGDARAYPIRMLNWHEIVNDVVGGEPLSITYCPLCGTGIVFNSTFEGQNLTFGVSGRLYRNDLVMYDHQSGSFWSQVMGEALQGQHKGKTLEQIQAWTLSWGKWKELHPDTKLLQPVTNDNGNWVRNYNVDPYGDYENNRETLFSVEHTNNSLHPKTWIAGVNLKGEQRAYTFEQLQERQLILDEVGGENLVLTWANGAPSAFHAGSLNLTMVNDTTMKDSAGVFYDMTTGRITANFQTGSADLEPYALTTGFWFGWYDFYPETTIYSGSPEGDSDNEPRVRSNPALGLAVLVGGLALAGAIASRRRN